MNYTMTNKCKIEILTRLRDNIQKNRCSKYGLSNYSLCYHIFKCYNQGLINKIEKQLLEKEFMKWAESTSYFDSNYAAHPKKAQPRIDYLNKRIEELQKEMK